MSVAAPGARRPAGRPEARWHRERTDDGVTLALLRTAGEVRYPTPVLLTHGTFSNAQTCVGLADFLARQGFDCWTLELRGHGRSEPANGHTDFEQFGRFDVPAAVRAVRRLTARPAALLVGHSGGGLAFLMHLARRPEQAAEVRGVVTLAAQATDAGRCWRSRAAIMGVALVNRALGYLPGPRLGLGPESEAGGVMRQWFRWNRRRGWTGADGFDYLAGLGRVTVPALCLAGGGDWLIAPPAGCQRLWAALGSQDKRFVLCARSQGFLEDYGHARVIASRRARVEVWPLIAAWLEQRAGAAAEPRLARDRAFGA